MTLEETVMMKGDFSRFDLRLIYDVFSLLRQPTGVCYNCLKKAAIMFSPYQPTRLQCNQQQEYGGDINTLCGYLSNTWGHGDLKMLSAFLALCEGNPLVTGGFPSQRACNVEIFCFLCCQPYWTSSLSFWWFEMPWCSCDVTIVHQGWF